METRVDEIADGIFQLSTSGLGPRSVNGFLIDADEPLMFHAGTRSMFSTLSRAVSRLMPLDRLRWLSFSHVEADEVGAMNDWLGTVPGLTAVHTPYGCRTSIDDLADRTPTALASTETMELGGRRIRLVPTPHVPHNPEAAMLFEEVTATLCCSDLGSNDALVAVVDHLDLIVDPVDAWAEPAASWFPGLTSITAHTAPILRQLAALRPRTLAIMHGASLHGAGATDALSRLAAECAARMGQMADATDVVTDASS